MANANPSPESRWVKGQTGNPGGRPAGEKGFRELCREALRTGMPLVTSAMSEMTPPQLTEAMEFLAKWSGYVTGESSLRSEVERLRAVCMVLMTDTLTKEQRDKISGDYREREKQIAEEMAA